MDGKEDMSRDKLHIFHEIQKNENNWRYYER